MHVDVAAAKRLARGIRRRIGLKLHFREQRLEIGLVRGAGDHGDLLSLQQLGAQIGGGRVAPDHKTRRHAIIGIGEIEDLSRLRRHRDRGDQRVAAIFRQSRHECIEAAHLDGAGDFQFIADRAREVDVKAGRIAVGAGVVERRIIGFGQETDDGDARGVRALRAPARIPEARYRRHRRGLLGDGRLRECRSWIAGGRRQQEQAKGATRYGKLNSSHGSNAVAASAYRPKVTA